MIREREREREGGEARDRSSLKRSQAIIHNNDLRPRLRSAGTNALTLQMPWILLGYPVGLIR